MSKKPVIGPVPSNTAEASEQLARIGALERAYRTEEARMNAELAATKARFAPGLTRLGESVEREIAGLQVFAEVHRNTLLPKDAKSVALPAGRIGWRLTPWKVTFLRGGAEKALAFLKSRRSKRFLRITTEIDKEALLRHRPKIDGIRYKQSEDFFVEPNADQATVAMGEVLIAAMR